MMEAEYNYGYCTSSIEEGSLWEISLENREKT